MKTAIAKFLHSSVILIKSQYLSTSNTYLENETIFWLQMEIQHGCLYLTFKVHVAFARHVESWEEISDETHEHWQVIGDNFGNVKITQCSHQYLTITIHSFTCASTVTVSHQCCSYHL